MYFVCEADCLRDNNSAALPGEEVSHLKRHQFDQGLIWGTQRSFTSSASSSFPHDLENMLGNPVDNLVFFLLRWRLSFIRRAAEPALAWIFFKTFTKKKNKFACIEIAIS